LEGPDFSSSEQVLQAYSAPSHW